jgi:hypothetical protein
MKFKKHVKEDTSMNKKLGLFLKQFLMDNLLQCLLFVVHFIVSFFFLLLYLSLFVSDICIFMFELSALVHKNIS